MGFAEHFEKYKEKGRVVVFKSRSTSAQNHHHPKKNIRKSPRKTLTKASKACIISYVTRRDIAMKTIDALIAVNIGIILAIVAIQLI